MSEMLAKKILRDLWRAKWQYLAVGMMVFLGVVFLIASYSTYYNLDGSYKNSYRLSAFEDFGVVFNAAPERVADRVLRIPGVTAVEGRLVEDVAIELGKDSTRKLVGRLISVPVGRPPTVNQLKLVSGKLLSGKTEHGVLLEATFAKHNKLVPGDDLRVYRGQAHVNFKIEGIVQSAEYLYVVRSKQELMPMPDTFGVMFISKDVLGPLLGKAGQINEVRVRISDPARLETVMREASRSLAVYRPDPPVPQKDQPSYQMLQQDVKGFRSYAVLFPMLFLGVAAATVYTMLLRMVFQQRPVIGLLRSLGFTRGQVVFHYLSSAIFIGVASSALGVLAGLWLAGVISRFYMSQLQVPYEQVIPRWGVAATGFVIGVLTCVLAGTVPARKSAAIRPAEAMRPVSPTFGRSSVMLDAILPIRHVLWRMPLRNVFRQPRRTLSTIFGMIAGMALMITARGILDSMTSAIDSMISGSYRYDMRVDFIERQSESLLTRVRSWPGVARAEGTLEVPVEMKHGEFTYSSMVTGVNPGSTLLHLQDEAGEPMRISADGGIFGTTLKSRLHLEAGNIVQITLPKQYAKEPPMTREVRVIGFNKEAMATQAYMTTDEVRRLFRRDLELPPNAISGIQAVIDPKYERDIRKRMLGLPYAAAVTSIPEIKKMVVNMMSTMNVFVWIMEAFGVALALAMIFNMITVNVLERISEVATLRTIGVSQAMIAATITAENLIVALMGVGIGIPCGNWFVQMFWRAAQTEEQQDLFTFNVQVSTETFVFASVAILVITVLSQIPALVTVGRLNLAQATKERST